MISVYCIGRLSQYRKTMIKFILHYMWSLIFYPTMSIPLPECRPEECLSSHSGIRGCTLICNYSAPALGKTWYILTNTVMQNIRSVWGTAMVWSDLITAVTSRSCQQNHSRPSAISRRCHPSPDPPLSLWMPGWRTRSKASSTCWNQSAATNKASARALS